jgi:hypothetical protein
MVTVVFKVHPLAFKPMSLGATFAGQVGNFHLTPSSESMMRGMLCSPRLSIVDKFSHLPVVFLEALNKINNVWEESHITSLHE